MKIFLIIRVKGGGDIEGEDVVNRYLTFLMPSSYFMCIEIDGWHPTLNPTFCVKITRQCGDYAVGIPT